jgi:hypothetical protein
MKGRCIALAGAVAALALLSAPPSPAQTATGGAAGLSQQEAREIARDAYVYAYPLVLTEVTRRVMTNVERPQGLRGPMNQVAHARGSPDASFADLAHPAADTLGSMMFADVSKEPLVVSVPDPQGRYYRLALLDMWSEVFAVRGKRTGATAAQTFAVVGPHWQGRLPRGVGAIRSPTAIVVLTGRTQADGTKPDLAAAHRFQDGIRAVPLAQHGQRHAPPKGRVDAQRDMGAPSGQVERMDAAAFFALFAELMKENPPHAADYPVLERLRRIGIEPGKGFALAAAPAPVQQALKAAPAEAAKRIKAAFARSGVLASGWRSLAGVGSYGTDYLQRAAIAWAGLGAGVPEDVIHAIAFADADGQPLSGERSYVLHFRKDQLPPVNAFWSLTLYDDGQRLAANPIDRHALSDRDKLWYGDDGSLDLIIQREAPGGAKDANWLPAPAGGPFALMLRLHWPRPEALKAAWTPPPVRQQEPDGVGSRALR